MRQLTTACRLALLATLTAMVGSVSQAGPGSRVVRQAVSPTAAAGAVRLTLTEGTNIAASMSPDGRTIAIDLVGSIWTLSATGGKATRLTPEYMDARQPSWSPDGRRVAFQAYVATTWQIWTMDADGGNRRAITWGPYDDREPAWSPDGARIAFASDRGDAGNYNVWTVTLATGELKQVTSAPDNEFMPSWTAQGDVVFASDRRTRPGIYLVDGSGRSSGERMLAEAAGALSGGAVAPEGVGVAFSSIEGAHSRLIVSGRNIADENEDVFPFRPQWISTTELLYTADGKIKRRPAAGGPAKTIEFSADVSFERPPFTPKRRNFDRPGSQPVRGIMHPAISPDGSQVAFCALGDLWVVPVSGGQARKLTDDPFVEMAPAWSPDGKRIAFSSDRDGLMRIWVRDLASGADRRLTTGNAIEIDPAWSSDGQRIAFLDAAGAVRVADLGSGPSSSSEIHARLNEPGRPTWSPDDRFVIVGALQPYSTRFREGTNQPVRIPVRGGDDAWVSPERHKSIGMREIGGPVWSPDGTGMAAIVDGHLVAWTVARDGTPTGPLRQLSDEISATPTWTADSHHLLYQTANRLKLVDTIDNRVQEIDPGLTWTSHPGAPTQASASEGGRPSRNAQHPSPNAQVIHAGRFWDGRPDAVRTDVDIVIGGERIRRVEPHSPSLHTGSVVDASNQTVMPGLIEIHSHLSKEYGSALGKIWLAWGITTVRNPATDPYEALEEIESVESGRRAGPRLLSAGDPFDGTRIYYPGGLTLDGGAQLTEQLSRAETFGYDFVKTYVRLPDLLQKRVIEEAHRHGMPVTSHELYPAVAYGADGVEHIRGTSRRGYSPKVSQLNRTYEDVIQLLAASKMTITPTVGIQGGFQLQTIRDRSWMDDPRVNLYPSEVLAPYRSLIAAPHDETEMSRRVALNAPLEQTVRRVVRAGGRVVAGTDAPINPYGLALLAEIEQYVAGGLTPAQALRTATSVSADAVGLGADLGTLEPGKLADIIVVDGNPLADIRDIRRVVRTFKGGIDQRPREPRTVHVAPVFQAGERAIRVARAFHARE